MAFLATIYRVSLGNSAGRASTKGNQCATLLNIDAMHIITRKRLLEAARKHPNAGSKIAYWHAVAKASSWTSLVETRKTFSHADQVTVQSGRTVTVFNLANDYRLITAIHYNRKKVFILLFLTHPEYDKEKWKEIL